MHTVNIRAAGMQEAGDVFVEITEAAGAAHGGRTVLPKRVMFSLTQELFSFCM